MGRGRGLEKSRVKLLLSEGQDEERKKKLLKRLAWADEVGKQLLQVIRFHDDDEERTLDGSGKNSSQDQKVSFNGDQQ